MDEPGFHAAWGTRISIWRFASNTCTPGAGLRTAPVASRRSASAPCTVRNSWAGAVAFAPWGNGTGAGEEPMAIVVAARWMLTIVLSVSRNAVASASGLTRSSTRSAAFCA